MQLHDHWGSDLQETVFFSWQSDRLPKAGKNLIEDALQQAISMLAESSMLEKADRGIVRIDQDTKDEAGSPPIVETLLGKIDNAGVFVPDLTFVGKRADGRPTPNPNVLIEYGWALKARGHKYIVPVMNIAHGTPTDSNLPFDLRHLRHPISYNCPDEADDAEILLAQEGLANELAQAISAVLNAPDFVSRRNPEFMPQRAFGGGGRFRDFGEPLGIGDPIEGKTLEIELENGSASWLRVMPLRHPQKNFPVRQLRRLLKPDNEECRLKTFRRGFNALSFSARDGYGVCDKSHVQTEENRISATGTAFMFTSGEIWFVDAARRSGSGIRNMFSLNEDMMVRLMTEYCALLQELGAGAPYRWIAGIEDVLGQSLMVPGQLMPSGSCSEDLIEVEGHLRSGEDARDSLEVYFASVYSKCGVSRDEALRQRAARRF